MSGPWLRKQNSTWYVWFDGQQKNLGKDKAEAFHRWHRLKGERSKGTASDNYPVREVLDDYWRWLAANRGAETSKNRKPALKSFEASLPTGMRILDLRPMHVQKWLDKNHPKCGPTRRNTLITWIKTAINWGVKMGYCAKSPIALMEKPTPNVRQDFVPVDQWQKLLDACKPDLRELVAVMLISGARVQEIFKYEAKHLEGARLVLPIQDSKGKRKSRVLHLPPAALEIVDRLAKRYQEGKLFRTSQNVAWNRNTLRCRFRYLKRVMKMPGLCATTLRHSWAHHRLESGQDSLIVSKLLGHSDGRMLAQRYGHIEEGNRLAIEASHKVPPLVYVGSSMPQGQMLEP